MWKGEWKDNVYTGEYAFPDGTVFKGTASWLDKHVIVHMTPDGFSKVVESAVEPHFEFTGSWVAKDGTAGFPASPPPPARSAGPAIGDTGKAP